MVTRDSVGSWLEGGPGGRDDGGVRGARLGLAPTGPGSLARLGRRLAALSIDWVACLAVSALLLPARSDGLFLLRGDSLGTLAVFALENLVLVGALGHTLGHRLMGLQVRRTLPQPPAGSSPVSGGPPGLLAALVRTALLCLVLPAAVWDGDGRGLHDRAAGTVLVRR
ncbi:RDD family protein [Cellulomonas dongxiuzhuiae]|uniref:RDD family protein n=1 Tax=Cellulomonas dongxiuzhuiae TaxID=2819979 RepID=A0ABX8GFZ7_9CELL|nr:RDD family protein [Cellulomonas dongxiuzhuiae]MBO3086920.1 RDD family protein [Cellulomonas dongxiuzhuiae]MBO3093723.1 RDD family protein [Cellulomonas dongxiuzhuiae]QWC14830.1 RDD family protein [Cellulomonas dongxiuzhuiae]